jgi:hypothetical protein
MVKTKKEALVIVGGLSNPSKMPGLSIGLPAQECKTGSKLRKIPGSVCSTCYAMKGCYTMYKAVKVAQYRRLEAINAPEWVPAMVKLIAGQEVFRWHDSGDLQSFEHLDNIVKVCNATPKTRHWMPTKEKGLVTKYRRKFGEFPKNLVVRVSMPMVDGKPTGSFKNTSTVHTGEPIGHECPAPKQGGACKDCRACWNPKIANVSYHKH